MHRCDANTNLHAFANPHQQTPPLTDIHNSKNRLLLYPALSPSLKTVRRCWHVISKGLSHSPGPSFPPSHQLLLSLTHAPSSDVCGLNMSDLNSSAVYQQQYQPPWELLTN